MSKNIRYWIIGNIVTLNTGILFIIFILANLHYKFLQLPPSYNFYIFTLLAPPFLTSIFIKFQKEDFPARFYSSIGWLYGLFLIFILRFLMYFSKNFLCYKGFVGELAFTFSFELNHFFYKLPPTFIIFLYIFLSVAIVSVIGGGLITLFHRALAGLFCPERMFFDFLRKLIKVNPLGISSILISKYYVLIVLILITGLMFRVSKNVFWHCKHSVIGESADYLLRDLRLAGKDVNVETCGIKKEDSIEKAMSTEIILYGDFRGNLPGIEAVRYFIDKRGHLMRTAYKQNGKGLDAIWVELLDEQVLVGNRFPEVSPDIRLAEGPVFEYLDYDLSPLTISSDSGLTEEQRKLIRRVNITFFVTSSDGTLLAYGMYSTGRLVNFVDIE